MKKIFVLGLVASMFLFGCGSDDDGKTTPGGGNGSGNGLTVQQKQRSSLFYYTATWCGPCGSFGSPTFKQTLDDNSSDELVAIDFHTGNSELVGYYTTPVSDTIFITAANRMLNNLDLPGTVPAFFLNQTFEGNNYDTRTISDKIWTHNSNDPLVGVAAKATDVNGKIEIDTKVEFFDEANEEYNLAVIIVEKSISHRQAVGSSYVDPFDHKMIARASARQNDEYRQTFYGDAMASGPITAGSTFEESLSFEWENFLNIPPQLGEWEYDKNNTAVAVFVLEGSGDSKKIVNCIMVDVE